MREILKGESGGKERSSRSRESGGAGWGEGEDGVESRILVGLKKGNRSRILAARTPAMAAQAVARKAVMTMAVGLLAPWVARIPMAVRGRSWMEAVLRARNVHMALVAVPGKGLRESRRRMARRPRGVAAFPRPSILAAIFMTMAPMAG